MAAKLSAVRLIHDIGSSVSINTGGDWPLWRCVYSGKPKPFFHPLCTPAGHCLTNFEPHDHLWHRGLWFTIKFLNGENFWEENVAHGTQVPSGLPMIGHEENGRIRISMPLRWVRPDGRGVVLEENRTFWHVPLDAGAYAIDFDFRLTACVDVLLDRTPYTTWGGYGGLTLRGTRNWQQTRILLADGSETDRPTGVRGAWADLSGKLDGGCEQSGGFAIFDHPANPRHPTPWYGGAEKYQNYLNAAMLFHEPMALAAGRVLELRYHVLVHDGIWDAPRLMEAWGAYVAESGRR